jgi:hypothetical protein
MDGFDSSVGDIHSSQDANWSSRNFSFSGILHLLLLILKKLGKAQNLSPKISVLTLKLKISLLTS